MSDTAQVPYPVAVVPPGEVQPVPRRIRATIGASTVLDTTRALYLWEWPFYPQYLIPAADVTPGLITEGEAHRLKRGQVVTVDLEVDGERRVKAGRRYVESSLAAIVGHVRFDWEALDAWYEEDEQVHVHPRNPYIRVDALRSSRRVRVERDGIVLADADATVMVFETGLPTRYYFDRTAVDFSHLRPTSTVTACPYKGITSDYWDFVGGDGRVGDLAWSYRFPTSALAPITGLVAFYDELVDTFVDGLVQPRPVTHHRRAR